MRTRALAALWLCKAAHGVLRLTGRGGTNLPGKLAVRLCPDLLRDLSAGVRITAVSGTNGKTTTCRIIEQAMQDGGKTYFANRSGANLLPGITTEFALHASLTGRPKCTYAVIECDEAAAVKAFPLMKPETVVLTNVFRDQLDRYGEVTHTLSLLRTACEGAPDAVLCINADDPLLHTAGEALPNRVCWYGVDARLYESGINELSDALYCPHCGTALRYARVSYGHLGDYTCPKCGSSRPDPEVTVTKAEIGADESRLALRIGDETADAVLHIPAAYNVYNGAAAAAALHAAGFGAEEIADALDRCACGFGRTESFALGAGIRMLLVKNPAGCNQVLRYLAALHTPCVLTFCLNDRAADGTDISWIWDGCFEILASCTDSIRKIYLSGERAEELAVRLKYAGLGSVPTETVRDYAALTALLSQSEVPAYVVPTYTAMMDLRPHLAKAAGSRAFWE